MTYSPNKSTKEYLLSKQELKKDAKSIFSFLADMVWGAAGLSLERTALDIIRNRPEIEFMPLWHELERRTSAKVSSGKMHIICSDLMHSGKIDIKDFVTQREDGHGTRRVRQYVPLKTAGWSHKEGE